MSEIELKMPTIIPLVRVVVTDEVLYLDTHTEKILAKLTLDTLCFSEYPLDEERYHPITALRVAAVGHARRIQEIWLDSHQKGRMVRFGQFLVGASVIHPNDVHVSSSLSPG